MAGRWSIILGFVGLAMMGLHQSVAAPAVEIKNAQWGFRSTYPAGWVVQQGSTGPIYVSAAPPAPETLVRCNTTAETVAETQVISQARLNAGLSTPVPPEFWSQQVFGRFQKVKVESNGSRLHPSGVQVQEAVVSYDDLVSGKTVRGRTSTTIFVTPGATFSLSCNAQVEKFTKYKTDFAAIVASFRVKDTQSVNVMPPVGEAPMNVSFPKTLIGGAVAAGVALADE